jgi:hypothetical protein
MHGAAIERDPRARSAMSAACMAIVSCGMCEQLLMRCATATASYDHRMKQTSVRPRLLALLAPLTPAHLHLASPPRLRTPCSATQRYKTVMSSEAELDRAAAALVAFISASPHSSGPPGRVSCGIGLYSEFCKTYPSHAASIRSQGGMRAFVTSRRELLWIGAMAGISEPRIGLSGVSPQRASQPPPPPQQQPQPPPQEQPQ